MLHVRCVNVHARPVVCVYVYFWGGGTVHACVRDGTIDMPPPACRTLICPFSPSTQVHTRMAYLSLSPLVLGAVLVGLGSGSADYNFTGAVLMVIATFASSIKMVTTHSVIRQVTHTWGK